MSTHSNAPTLVGKPPKPYPAFPLTPHNVGVWQKKINGRLYYFGRWGRVVNGVMTRVAEDGDWANALRIYEAQKNDLYAGRVPRKRTVGGEIVDDDDAVLTVKRLCNEFLTAKQSRLDQGRMTKRSFDEFFATATRVSDCLGKDRPVDDLSFRDFNRYLAQISRTWGPVRVGNEITRVKSIFKFGLLNGLLTKPVPYGSEFRKPGMDEIRKERNRRPKKMLEANELKKLLAVAPPIPRAMVLLGLNCGFGNTDCATLPLSVVDLKRAIIDYPRPKTGIERRCPLWPETVAALREVIAERPEPTHAEGEGLVFLNEWGRQFLHGGIAHPITRTIGELMKRAKVHRTGVGLYAMRHIFRTVADETLDRAAIDRIMGHADHSMAGHYRERIADERLLRVTTHVRNWLFAEMQKGGDE